MNALEMSNNSIRMARVKRKCRPYRIIRTISEFIGALGFTLIMAFASMVDSDDLSFPIKVLIAGLIASLVGLTLYFVTTIKINITVERRR